MELQVTTKGAFLLTRPYTGDAWRVNTIYKDALISNFFTNETEANFFADAYLANTGDTAKITKSTFINGERK
jgi:hypothetical protein